MPALTPSTPLTRLHSTATHLGIIVLDAVDDDGPWLDDDSAAIVACGELIALNPGLDDDGLRADVLAMALAVTWFSSPGETGNTRYHGSKRLHPDQPHPGSRAFTRTGKLAAVIASQHGRDTAYAAFEYTVAVFE